MSKISLSLRTRCPYGRAKDFLRDELSPMAATGHETTHTLHVTVQDHALSAPVVMHYSFGFDPMGFDQPWLVSWTPRDRALYPSFTGMLTIRADESWDTSMLEITGEYVPPFGIPGKVFDAAVGNKIATATARQLLAEIRAKIDARYDAEEESKELARLRVT